jgi:hypothetical protein
MLTTHTTDAEFAARLIADTKRIRRAAERKANLRMLAVLTAVALSGLIVIAAGWGILAVVIAAGKSFGL